MAEFDSGLKLKNFKLLLMHKAKLLISLIPKPKDQIPLKKEYAKKWLKSLFVNWGIPKAMLR